MYKLLKSVIKEVRQENEVEIVTDNGSGFVKASKLLMKKYNIYCTPGVTHCIKLMFEDIGKRAVLMKASKLLITNSFFLHK